METIRQMFSTVGQIMKMKVYLGSYSFSFLNLFAFICIASVCGYVIVRLLRSW